MSPTFIFTAEIKNMLRRNAGDPVGNPSIQLNGRAYLFKKISIKKSMVRVTMIEASLVRVALSLFVMLGLR